MVKLSLNKLILILSFTLGLATSVVSEPKAGEILQNGKILHMKVIDDGGLFPEEIVYHVASDGHYFECHYTDNANSEKSPEVICSSVTSRTLIEKDFSAVRQVEELIEKKIQKAMNSSKDLEITEDAEDPFVTTYYTFPDNFTTNLKGSKVFLQFNIGVSTQYDKIVMENVEIHQLALRSEILDVVSEFPAEELRGMEGLKNLAYSIKETINNRLEILEGFGGVEEVFFTSLNIK